MAASAKHNSKKEAIINSTISVMQKLGYEETSVRAICDAANISIGTFYHYFKDKSELLLCILGKIDVYLEEEVAPILTSSSDRENLRQFALGFARQTVGSGSAYGGVLSSPSIPLPGQESERLRERQRTLYRLPREIILHGQESGEFLTDFSAEELVDKLITCLRGCAMDWARRDFCYDIEAYIGSFMDIFCSAIIRRK